MGYTAWSDDAYTQLSNARTVQTRDQIFGSKHVDPTMNPHGLGIRESCDSPQHPDSVPIVVAFDVTGSMGTIPERFAREELGGLMRMLVDRGYVVDPQLLFAAIGDACTDAGPFQVGQFESGLEMDMWLTKIWIEGGGGGQRYESYALAHWFAANHTRSDAWDKRKKKGYLFTMGDEMTWNLPRDHLKNVFGDAAEKEWTALQAVQAASERWQVFHIIVTEGYHGKDPDVLQQWRDLLGERALVLPDAHGICALIAQTIALPEGTVDLAGARTDLVAMNLGAATADAVSTALVPVAAQAMVSRPAHTNLVPSKAAGGVDRL